MWRRSEDFPGLYTVQTRPELPRPQFPSEHRHVREYQSTPSIVDTVCRDWQGCFMAHSACYLYSDSADPGVASVPRLKTTLLPC